MSGTPFFETIATTTQVTGIKRCASERETGLDLLHNDLDMLVRTKKDQFLPLSVCRGFESHTFTYGCDTRNCVIS